MSRPYWPALLAVLMNRLVSRSPEWMGQAGPKNRPFVNNFFITSGGFRASVWGTSSGRAGNLARGFRSRQLHLQLNAFSAAPRAARLARGLRARQLHLRLNAFRAALRAARLARGLRSRQLHLRLNAFRAAPGGKQTDCNPTRRCANVLVFTTHWRIDVLRIQAIRPLVIRNRSDTAHFCGNR